jgi:hypothetical protein
MPTSWEKVIESVILQSNIHADCHILTFFQRTDRRCLDQFALHCQVFCWQYERLHVGVTMNWKAIEVQASLGEEEILTQLAQAHIVLLFLSPSFLQELYVLEHMYQHLQSLQRSQPAVILSGLVVRAVLQIGEPFIIASKFVDAVPLMQMTNARRDQEFVKIMQWIRGYVDQLLGRRDVI